MEFDTKFIQLLTYTNIIIISLETMQYIDMPFPFQSYSYVLLRQIRFNTYDILKGNVPSIETKLL